MEPQPQKTNEDSFKKPFDVIQPPQHYRSPKRTTTGGVGECAQSQGRPAKRSRSAESVRHVLRRQNPVEPDDGLNEFVFGRGKDSFTVGRLQTCDVNLRELCISRLQATIVRGPGDDRWRVIVNVSCLVVLSFAFSFKYLKTRF
jgi:hypothetical protein